MSLTKVTYSMINGVAVNVLDFGTNTTPGTTDMTAAFIAAAAAGTQVYVPPGNYVVGDCSIATQIHLFSDAPIDINGHTTGMTTITLKPGASRIFKLGSLVSHVLGIRISGINFYGNDQVVTDLIRVEGASFVYITDNAFNNCNGKALSLQKVWEGSCHNNSFRYVGGPNTKPAIYFDAYTDAVPANNVNNFRVINNTFGSISGGCIGSDVAPNLDLIFIKDNKFEFDTATSWPNTTTTPVISLASPTRTTISGNGFANYLAANEYYSTIIKLSGTSAGPVDISGNQLVGCAGIFLDHQGTCGVVTVTPNYYVYNGVTTLTVTSSSAYSISGETLRSFNTNGSLSRPLNRGPFTVRQFYPAVDTYSSTSRTLVVDAAALSPNGLVKSVASAGTFDVFMWEPLGLLSDSPGVTTITVAVRVKARSADTAVQLYVDATGYTNIPVTLVAGWTWVTWAITKATLTSASLVKVFCTDVDGCLFDGFMVYTA